MNEIIDPDLDSSAKYTDLFIQGNSNSKWYLWIIDPNRSEQDELYCKHKIKGI